MEIFFDRESTKGWDKTTDHRKTIDVGEQMSIDEFVALLAEEDFFPKKGVWRISDGKNKKGRRLGYVYHDEAAERKSLATAENIKICELAEASVYGENIKIKGKEETFFLLLAAADYLKKNPKVEFTPYPVYAGEIMDVLGSMEDDKNYAANHDELEGKPIEDMNLKNIATMYTFIVRGERFCDGHIAGYVEDGTLYRLVLRHLELLEK